MNKQVLMPLADGFEEIEAFTVIDILRRSHIDIISASLFTQNVNGSQRICTKADVLLNDIKNKFFDMIVLPGGSPGTRHLRHSDILKSMLISHFQAGKLIAAICAAPTVLAAAGILKGKTITSYPGVFSRLDNKGFAYCEKSVCVDLPFITSRSPATALAFSLKIVEILTSQITLKKLESNLLL